MKNIRELAKDPKFIKKIKKAIRKADKQRQEDLDFAKKRPENIYFDI